VVFVLALIIVGAATLSWYLLEAPRAARRTRSPGAAAARSPDRPRTSIPRPDPAETRAPALAEYGSYALAIVLVCSPGLLHARTQIFGAATARCHTWLGWRMGRLIAHGHVIPLRIGDVIHPFGLDLRLLDGYLLFVGSLQPRHGTHARVQPHLRRGAMCNIAAARPSVAD
jgi:hypothetical protein